MFKFAGLLTSVKVNDFFKLYNNATTILFIYTAPLITNFSTTILVLKYVLSALGVDSAFSTDRQADTQIYTHTHII